ncbi:hypothetical protein DHL47_05935 [Streptococcus panodentis]|uniref:Uncharacterized protein n=1 Tax=Streptococcus panodentis TaxID=1581472 RepID=A0ABS5AWD2_9STRE|nr:hypothetical protein [Streptococcus panodentis]
MKHPLGSVKTVRLLDSKKSNQLPRQEFLPKQSETEELLYGIFQKIHPSVDEDTAIMGVCLSLFEVADRASVRKCQLYWRTERRVNDVIKDKINDDI